MKKPLLLLTIVVALASGCKKKTINPLELTGKRWHLVKVTAKPEALPVPVINVYDDLINACAKDDYIYYRADSTVYYDDGLDKCDPNQPQRIEGVWRFRDNNKRLRMDGYVIAGVTLNEVDVLELTSDKMVISYRYNDPTQTPLPLIATGTLETF